MEPFGQTWTIVGAVVAIVSLLVGPLYARLLKERDHNVQRNTTASGDNSEAIQSIGNRVTRIETQLQKLDAIEDQSDETKERVDRIENELSLVKHDLQVIHDNTKENH